MGKGRQGDGGLPHHDPFCKWRMPSLFPLSRTGRTGQLQLPAPPSFNNWVAVPTQCIDVALQHRCIIWEQGISGVRQLDHQVYNGLASHCCDYGRGATAGWEAGVLPQMAGISCRDCRLRSAPSLLRSDSIQIRSEIASRDTPEPRFSTSLATPRHATPRPAAPCRACHACHACHAAASLKRTAAK